jgi:plastocyanin
MRRTIIFLFLFAAAAPATVLDVGMFDFRFTPETVAAAPGDTIRWINYGTFSHNTVSGRPDSAAGQLWSSPFLATGDTWLLPVTFSGPVPYYCSLHPLSMRGVVGVTTGIGDRPGSLPVPRLSVPSLNPTSLTLELPAALPVSVGIYDAIGRLRLGLLDRAALPAGQHRFGLNPAALEEGIYILSVTAGEWSRAARLVIAR